MFSDPDTIINQMYISEGMTTADFGCGAGFYTIRLAKKVGPYGRVFAIDTHGDLLRKIKNESVHSGLQQVEIIQGDLESVAGSGLLSASVDRVIVSNVLFQVDNPQKVLEEAKRILKHDGKVAIVEWQDSFSQIGPHLDHVISENEIKDICEKVGLVLEGNIDAGTHHYGLLYKNNSINF
jgi:ubiquinone/menaquinone biosynthesis C-methylase UbiE